MKKIFRAPEDITLADTDRRTIFLAGSIEMDQAVQWQQQCEAALSEHYTLFNPRRAAWNAEWEQSIYNAFFREQVEWELNALDRADIILLFLANNTKSPISLLELGLYASSGKMYVVVEDGFWRKGNVDIVCNRYHIPQFATLEAVILHLLT